jgi:hypothetical protein
MEQWVEKLTNTRGRRVYLRRHRVDGHTTLCVRAYAVNRKTRDMRKQERLYGLVLCVVVLVCRGRSDLWSTRV